MEEMGRMVDGTRMVTVAEVRARWGCTESKVYAWLKSGRLNGRRVGTRRNSDAAWVEVRVPEAAPLRPEYVPAPLESNFFRLFSAASE